MTAVLPIAPADETYRIGQGWVDLLFALTVACLFTRAEIDTHIFYREFYYRVALSLPMMWATSAVVLIGLAKRAPLSPLLSLPLAAFALNHGLSAARLGGINGFREGAQALSVFAFALAFGARYTAVSIRRFVIFFAPMGAAIMAYNIEWHIERGYYYQWKRLYNPKALFDLLPLITAGFLLTRRKFPAVLAVVLMIAAGLLILLSGERKAYIAFIIAIAVMLNPRNPLAYLVPILAVIGIYIAVQLIGSHYVARQVQTILATVGIGDMPDSVSSTERAWQLHLGGILFHQHPWLGVGTNGYKAIAETEYSQTVYAGIGLHGELLRVTVENGILGLGLYLGFLVTSFLNIFRKSIRAERTSGEMRTAILWFLSLLFYVSFEGSNLLLMVMQYSMAYIWSMNLGRSDRVLAPRSYLVGPAALPRPA
jgi:hypothetical protein